MKIYVVIGWTGVNYESDIYWVVAAFRNEDNANCYAKDAKKESEIISDKLKKTGSYLHYSYNNEKDIEKYGKNKFDSKMKIQDFRPEYSVVETELD